MIPIPDSVAFYWGDPVNRAAIDVLGPALDPPGDLTLAEAERFTRAGLAVRRVRLDYAGLLRAVWMASWAEAVRRHLPAARLLSYGEHLAYTQMTDLLAHPAVDRCWAERAVAGVFDLPGHGRLFTRLALVENESEGQLGFYLIDADQSCAVTDALTLTPDWRDDGEHRRVTVPGLLPLARGAGYLDPEPFAVLALGAAAALAAALA